MKLFVASVLLAALTASGQIAAPTGAHFVPSEFNDQIGFIYAQISWTDNADNETHYAVDVSTNGTAFFQEQTLPPNSTSCDTIKVPWTSNRWYRIRAYNASGSSAPSETNHMVGNMPPAKIRGTTSQTNTIRIIWESSGGLIDGYKIQMDTTTNFNSGSLSNFIQLGQEAFIIDITNQFAFNTFYYFRVLSTSVGGDSVAYEKPLPYLKVAPNGPPIEPIFVAAYTTSTSTNSQTSTDIRILFDDFSLNKTGYQLDHSLDSNIWVNVPFAPVDQARQDQPLDHYLLPGRLYYYRLKTTNTAGSSAWVTFSQRTPNVAPAGVTNWYVDPLATGDDSGRNWANAFRTTGQLNWYRIGPGHTVYISGGTNTQTFEDYLVTGHDGTSDAPVRILLGQDAGHNGRAIIHGEIGIASRWVTIDGAKDTNFVVTSRTSFTNNIGIEVLGRDSFDQAINMPIATGIVLKWIECHGVGNPNSPDSLSAVSIASNENGPESCEFAYNWVHDNWANGVDEQAAGSVPYGTYQVNLHHNLIEQNRNNQMTISRSMDIHDNIIRDTQYPAISHPDGIQGGITDIRLTGNIVGNCAGTTFYPNLSNPGDTNLIIVNNYFYNTNLDANYGALAIQFSWIGDGPHTMSNVIVAGNTFYGGAANGFSVGSNSKTNYLKSWRVANNIWYAGASTDPGSAFFSLSAKYTTNDVIFDHNVGCGKGRLIYFQTNGFDNLYPDVLKMQADTLTTGNSTNFPVVLSVSANKFQLMGSDTAARGRGTNLSVYSSMVPAITNDIDGHPRQSWDIGAYESNTNGLLFQFTFEDDFYSATNKFTADVSGHGHDLRRFGRPTSMTNYPGLTNGYDGGSAAHFRSYPNDLQQGQTQYFTGDYGAVTNLTGLLRITNLTWSAWVNYDQRGDDMTLIGGGGALDDGNWMVDNINGYTELSVVTNGVRITEQHLMFWPDFNITNAWHLYTLTWSGTNHTLTGYFDGVPFTTNTLTLSQLTAFTANINSYLGIGCWTFDEDPWIFPTAIGGNDNHPNNGWLLGSMDDVRLYDYALSSSEVSGLYADAPASVQTPPASAPSAPSSFRKKPKVIRHTP